MMERGKEVEKNEKEEWRNEGCALWRGKRRGMESGKLWIGVWMRENERERGGGEFVEDERESRGKIKLQTFQISNYEREFHKIHINRRRERIVQHLKGCVSSRGAMFCGEMSTLLKGCLKNSFVKM